LRAREIAICAFEAAEPAEPAEAGRPRKRPNELGILTFRQNAN
jgi:hypothetical protein